MQLEGTLGKPLTTNTESGADPMLSSTKKLGQDEFLNLLITKLQNQDPMDPQDDLEFIGQLAQFSNLEQLVDANASLVALLEQQRELFASQQLSMLGQEVVVFEDTFTVEGGSVPGIGYELPESAGSVVVSIFDSTGKLVRGFDDAPKTAGEHEVRFDGKDQGGRPLADGSYRIRVGATDVSGEPLYARSYIRAEVTGIRRGEDGAVRLLLGSDEVELSEVHAVLSSSQVPEPSEEG